MAYSEKDLSNQWIPGVRIAHGENVNLSAVRDAIQEQCDENGIPVEFRDDQLKIGGLFSKEREDILIMYHPQHATDYLHFAIRVVHQGKYAFVNVFNLGGSVNYGNDNAAAEGGFFGTVRKIGNAVSGHQAKLEAEEQYYAILKDCLNNIFE